MTSFLPALVTGTIANGTDKLRSALGNLSWGPAVTVSRAAVTSLFTRIENGSLVVVDEVTGKTERYGKRSAKENRKLMNGDGIQKSLGIGKVGLVVRKESFWVRVFLFADMGFAEAFMLGEVQCFDLTSFFQVSQTP